MVASNVADIKAARHNGVDCFIRVYLIMIDADPSSQPLQSKIR